MKNRKCWHWTLVCLFVFVLGVSLVCETSAWARAGGGRSFGSRGSRSFSTPRMPSSPSYNSPYTSRPSYNTPQSSTSPFSTGWGRSPFTQGLLGGLAGGFLGNMLFGGRGYASAGGGGGGGIGLLDILLIGFLVYLLMKFLRARRTQTSASSSYYGGDGSYLDRIEGNAREAQQRFEPSYNGMHPIASIGKGDAQAGIAQIRQFDPSFTEEGFKELAQDMFFRIQAAWMNRNLDGIEQIITDEMAEFFRNEFNGMKKQGRINRLENIAVRKVELSEVWQETGKEYITVLFTANLLDYTVDDKTGQVVEGDRLNPVKFQEFWTFCREVGRGSAWRLSAIQQSA